MSENSSFESGNGIERETVIGAVGESRPGNRLRTATVPRIPPQEGEGSALQPSVFR